jgi:putative membrane protein
MRFIGTAGRIVTIGSIALLTSAPALALDRGDVPSPIAPAQEGIFARKVPADSNAMPSVRLMPPRSFLEDAAEGGRAEVELAGLAPKRAYRDDVKKFAATMAQDHTTANRELTAIAQRDGVALPESLDAKHKQLEEKLSKLNGKPFDVAYMQAMVDDHEQDVKLFENAASNGSPEVQSFASSTLPVLQKHLAMARDINQKVAQSSATSPERGGGD